MWGDREASPAVAPSLEGFPAPQWGAEDHPSKCISPHPTAHFSHPLWGRGWSKERAGQRETGSDNKASQKTDLKEYVASPRGWQRQQSKHQECLPLAALWAVPVSSGRSAIWGWAGVPSLLPDLLITVGITIQASEFFPTGGEVTVPRVEGCAQQSRSGQARRRGWFHGAVSNPELGRWEGHPHPVRAVMVDRANWQQSCSGEPGSTQGKGLK